MSEAKTAMRQDYDKQKADREKMTQEAHQFPTPTPTQEENDLLALGLMTPDEIKPSGNPEDRPAVPARSRPVAPHSTAPQPAHPAEPQPRPPAASR